MAAPNRADSLPAPLDVPVEEGNADGAIHDLSARISGMHMHAQPQARERAPDRGDPSVLPREPEPHAIDVDVDVEALRCDLLELAADPHSFPGRAARLLAASLGPAAARVELYALRGPSLHPAAAFPPSGGGLDLAPAVAPALAPLLASPAPLSLPGGTVALRASAGPRSAPSLLVAVAPGPADPAGRSALRVLPAVAQLLAVGLQAARACAAEPVARALRRAAPGDLDAAAEAARASLRAASCVLTGAPRAGAAPPVLGASAGAPAPLLPPEAWVDLAAGRPARAGGALAVPVAAGVCVAGALIASGGPLDEDEAAACAWALYPVLSTIEPEPGGDPPRPPHPRPTPPARFEGALDRTPPHSDPRARPHPPPRPPPDALLVSRLVAEVGADSCAGFRASAETLCLHFGAARCAVFDLDRSRRAPRAAFAARGGREAAPADAEALVEGALGACAASPGGACALDGGVLAAAGSFDGTPLALFALEAEDGGVPWSPADAEALALFARHAAAALAQSRLRERLLREVRHSELLTNLVREISEVVDSSTIEHLFRRSAELVGTAFGADRCSIWMYLDNSYREPICQPQVVWARQEGIPTFGGGFDAAASAQLWQMILASPDGVLHIPVVGAAARALGPGAGDLVEKAELLQTKSTMCTRAVFRGEVQGLVSMETVHEEAKWTREHCLLFRQVAGHVAVAIAHGRLLAAGRAQNAELAQRQRLLERQLMHSGLLEAVTKEIHQILSVQEVFARSARLVREAFGSSRVRMNSLEDPGIEAIAIDPSIPPEVASVIMSTPQIDKMMAGRIADGYFVAMNGLAKMGRRLFPIRDAANGADYEALGFREPYLSAARAIFLAQRTKSVCFAFTSFQGKPNGVIGISQMDRHREWDDGEMRLLSTVSEQIGVAIQQAGLLAREKEQSALLEQRAAALEEARREADAASTAKSQFLAMVSHEIRTPMNAICNMSEFLLDTELSTQQHDFSSTIHTSSLALLNILNDILDTSRLEFNKVDIRREAVVLRDLLEKVVELMFPSAAQKGIDLTWHVARECPAVLWSDGARLNQILVNCLGNGVKFTSAGEVSVTAALDGPRLAVAVRDSGIGISDADQRKLFSWFFQADSSNARKYSGTGLGLFISRKLAVLLGGDLQVESALGRGSIFTLTLPLAAPPEPPPGAEPAPGPERRSPAPRALLGRRIALWSPSPATRALLSDAFEDAGAAVALLPDPGAPQAEAGPPEGEPPDCCVVDVAASPAGDASLVEGRWPWPALERPARVALLARGSAGRRGATLTCAGVIVKPVKPRAAVEAVAAALVRALEPKGRGGSPVDAARAYRAQNSPRPAVAPALRILVAEDVEVNKRILLLMLRKLRQEAVAAVSNGAEALAAVMEADAAGRQFHCLLLDVMMPVMDGLTCARSICEGLPPERRPYIVALTANAMAGDREQCLAAGMAGYIAKPVRMNELAAALEQAAAAGTGTAGGA